MSRVDETLDERAKRYGVFADQAKISQSLKRVMRNTEGWADLQDDQREALDMIAHKVARALNGDPNYIDNWTDIAGYSVLVERRLDK